MMRLVLIASSAALLCACGEFDQSKTANRHLPDVEPFQGAKDPYVVKGWTPGNRETWEKQIRERGQMQNEYLRTT
jgi:hypothetical protein